MSGQDKEERQVRDDGKPILSHFGMKNLDKQCKSMSPEKITKNNCGLTDQNRTTNANYLKNKFYHKSVSELSSQKFFKSRQPRLTS